jgi:hypothetical protein
MDVYLDKVVHDTSFQYMTYYAFISIIHCFNAHTNPFDDILHMMWHHIDACIYSFNLLCIWYPFDGCIQPYVSLHNT